MDFKKAKKRVKMVMMGEKEKKALLVQNLPLNLMKGGKVETSLKYLNNRVISEKH